MLRRIVYSIILVFMLEMNYLQIQLVIIKAALFAAYLGYFKVFLSRLQNNLELWNESLTLICAYCLIPFSGLVSDANTRYACGWPLILLVLILVIINLSVMMVQAISMMIHSCKLRMWRRRNRKVMHEKMQKMKDRLQEQLRLQREFRPENELCSLDGFGSIHSNSVYPNAQN